MACQENQRLLLKNAVPGLGVDVRTVLQELLDNEAVYIHRKTDLLRQPFFISHDYPFLHTRVKDLVGSITRLQKLVGRFLSTLQTMVGHPGWKAFIPLQANET